MLIGKMKFTKKDIYSIIAVVVSALIYSCGFNIFVRSGNLFPGGFAGVSRLLSMILEDECGIVVSFSIIYFILNILATLLVYKKVGHKFILYSVLWYTLASLFTGILDMPTITRDPLLIAVFGGLINGIAVGIALRVDASSGGTDFIAIDLSMRLNRPVWNYIFIFNVCVLIIAGMKYGWEQALYSIIYQYVSKEVISGLHERYKLTNVQVITDHPEDISSAVFKVCRHGITKIECTGMYKKTEHSLLTLTIPNSELHEVENCIVKADPDAFMTLTRVDRIIGNYYQRPIE